MIPLQTLQDKPQIMELLTPASTLCYKKPEIPWTVVIGVITSTAIILVTVLFKARYIYFEENPHSKGLKEKIEVKNKIFNKKSMMKNYFTTTQFELTYNFLFRYYG